MASDFDKTLDECIDRISHGESLESCLADHPEYAEQLEPLLRVVLQTRGTYSFEPSATSKLAARQRFNAALEQLERTRAKRQLLLPRVLSWSKAWIPVTIILLALIGYFALRPALFPTIPGPQPDPEGNFAFLISDEVNAIGDFQSLEISISKIGLETTNGNGGWIEFAPEVEVVDLTLLQGNKAQEIWRGDVPEGGYHKVFIHVSHVSGVLSETGSPVEVKLPSEKLQISKTFEVSSGSVTDFVYDLTVIAAGSPQSGIKYILKPEVGQSGADQVFEKIDGRGEG